MMKRNMLAAVIAAVSAQSMATLAACANDGASGVGPSDDANTPVPAPAVDGGLDAAEPDGSACTDDCEFFPDACTDDALCVASLFDGDAGSPGLDLRTHVHALVGRSPNDAWLSGAAGVVARFDGTSWRRSATNTQHSLYALWLLDGAEVAFDSPARIYARGLDAGADAPTSDDGWSPLGSATLASAWTQAAPRIEASWSPAGTHTLWIGVTTTRSTPGVFRMRYSPSDGRFEVTSPNANCLLVPCREVYGLDGVSADELWGVGPNGAAFRVTNAESDAPTFTGFTTDTMNALNGVWAAASNDVWAVGANGTVRRYRGDARAMEAYDELPSKQHLYAVAGSSPSDMWIAGDEGTVFHYDGSAWTRIKVAGLGARRPRLERIWVPSPGKVWIAGQGALVSLGGKP